MSDQDPPIARTRRKHNKVSTGCQNCKTRRVKCDETSPGCQRCTRARLRCGGYAPPKAWIFEPSGTSLEKSDKGKSPLIKHGCDDHPVLPDLSTERWSITSFANAPNLRMVWQSALLDTFLTSWFPDGLVRHVTTDEASGAVVPMSAWPLASWKLARKDGKVFVKHALLCLVLCVLGSRTNDTRLVVEASQHYARVLRQLRAQIGQLTDAAPSSIQGNQLASLAAVGFCCSQIEYMLHSWSTSDRHLEGMASLLHAYGPSCLQNENALMIFHDHCLLWVSCSVVHRQPSIYSKWPWREVNWPKMTVPSRNSTRQLLAICEPIPGLLQEYDEIVNSVASPAITMSLLHRLVTLIAEIQALNLPFGYNDPAKDQPTCGDQSTLADDQSSLTALTRAILNGYASAFIIHTAVTALSIAQTLAREEATSLNLNTPELSLERLKSLCGHHTGAVRGVVDGLISERYGLMTASPVLFFLDSAWIGYAALVNCSNHVDIIEKAWFEKVSGLVERTGYRPLRKPWNDTDNRSMISKEP